MSYQSADPHNHHPTYHTSCIQIYKHTVLVGKRPPEETNWGNLYVRWYDENCKANWTHSATWYDPNGVKNFRLYFHFINDDDAFGFKLRFA